MGGTRPVSKAHFASPWPGQLTSYLISLFPDLKMQQGLSSSLASIYKDGRFISPRSGRLTLPDAMHSPSVGPDSVFTRREWVRTVSCIFLC